MKNCSWLAALVATVAVAAAPVALAGGAGAAEKETAAKASVKPTPGCPDLVAKLTLGTSLVNGKGQVALHGKVCNEGTRDFVAPPQPVMRGEFQVVTWHPPKTPAQEHNQAVLGPPFPISSHIPVGQCVPYEEKYAFDGIARWLAPAVRPVLAAGERIGDKEFTFHLLSPASGYTPKQSDDCNTNNNSASVVVTYADTK
jgi:hypothetical protein